MKILLTNDDGIDGEGLHALAHALKEKGHDLLIAAPSENNSAVSHKITMRSAIPMKQLAPNIYAIGGTPVDCVLVALCYLNFRPDLILSGINAGVNVGSDVHYSGTVAGAMEGTLDGIPSIALSQYLHTWFGAENVRLALDRAAATTAENLPKWVELAKEAGMVNINFPAQELKGYRFCKQAHTFYNTGYELKEDGLHMLFNPPQSASDGDISLLKEGYVTITPLKTDLTDYEMLLKWEKRK